MDIVRITPFWELIRSPVGPAAILVLGAIVTLLLGRWMRRPSLLAGVALLFVLMAGWLQLALRTQSEFPIYSRPWQPLLQGGTNLVWIGDGWNWYIACLVLLIGGCGILLDWSVGTSASGEVSASGYRHSGSTMAVHLAFLGAALLFVGSGNLLTTILTWVMMDLLMLVRSALRPEDTHLSLAVNVRDNRARGLSLLGALLLLIGLLPAGPSGPGQPLDGGVVPIETAVLMLLAAAIRAGAYPFHLWLLPTENERVDLAQRLLDQMVPVLCGLWLLGWTVSLGGDAILLNHAVLTLFILMLLGSAIAAWTAPDQPNHTTFVLITSAGLAGLSGALAYSEGPRALIWPTTAFALGGGLWLIGERVWQEWGWQIPVSVGALALSGVPFTPGFLTQPGISRLLTTDPIFTLLFGLYVVAQTIQIAALLRSWGADRRDPPILRPMAVARLLAACIALGLPLAFAGFLPQTVATLASMPDAIPERLGNPPTVVADGVVWITLALPLLLGMGLAVSRPRFWHSLGRWPGRISHFTRLEWFFQASWWSVNRASETWGNAIGVVEGAGYMGWLAVFALFCYLLIT